MTPEQEKGLAEIGRQLQKLIPIRGKIVFNLIPGRDYVNINVEQSLAFEYDGRKIKDIRGRR